SIAFLIQNETFQLPISPCNFGGFVSCSDAQADISMSFVLSSHNDPFALSKCALEILRCNFALKHCGNRIRRPFNNASALVLCSNVKRVTGIAAGPLDIESAICIPGDAQDLRRPISLWNSHNTNHSSGP